MTILVINCGSSSIKFKLFSSDIAHVMAEGIVERVGEASGRVDYRAFPGTSDEKRVESEQPVADHGSGLQLVVDMLTGKLHGVISGRDQIAAVGHRVVHGGEHFHAPTLIDEASIPMIESVNSLAPLHNPANLKGIAVAGKLFEGIPHVAVFDTAFHQTLPPVAYRYAIPDYCYSDYNIRRYGFHGTSHQYLAGRAAHILGRDISETNLITLHLGSGCSITAVREGRSVDTSMGMTPLAGPPMGTRSGDLDPGVVLYFSRALGLSTQEIDRLLNTGSGLKGLCGDNDMRDIHRRRDKGDKTADLAYEMFIYAVRKYIGAYSVVLGRLDGLVFSAGIGENDHRVRSGCCSGLEILGIHLDEEKNSVPEKGPRAIHNHDSSVAILVIPTDEEYEIARQTALAI